MCFISPNIVIGERIVEDLIVNFAETWTDNRAVEVDQIDSFLTNTFADFFDADIAGTTTNLSRVLVRVYEECRSGQDTGVRHILGNNSTSSLLVDNNQLAPNSSASEMRIETVEQSLQSMEIQSQSSPSEPIDEDGWTTVARRKR